VQSCWKFGALILIDFVYGLDQPHRHVMFAPCRHQRSDILGETGAPVADAGIKEMRPDTRVGAQTRAHGFNITAHRIAQIQTT